MRSTLILVLQAAILAAALSTLAAPQPEIDAEARLVRVVDGDTVVVVIERIYNEMYKSLEGKEVRVRLADINAPERDTPQGEEATRRLKEILEHAKRYYLDIDDVNVTDRYGRIVAILYAETDGILINVNAKLVAEGHAEIWDHDNEFNPATWTTTITLTKQTGTTLEVETKENSSQETLVLAAATIAALIIVAAALIARLKKR